MDALEGEPFNLEMRWLETISFYFQDLIDSLGIVMRTDVPNYSQVKAIRSNATQVILALQATGRYKEDLSDVRKKIMYTNYKTGRGMQIIIEACFTLADMIAAKNLFKKKMKSQEERWNKIRKY